MKIKSIAAAGALGIGLGLAGLVGGTATASAETCSTTTPPLTPMRVACVTNEQIGTFIETANPATQLNTFVNGTNSQECDASGCTTVNDGLGIKDQPATFASSVGDFFNGPRSPE